VTKIVAKFEAPPAITAVVSVRAGRSPKRMVTWMPMKMMPKQVAPDNVPGHPETQINRRRVGRAAGRVLPHRTE